ncbi:MAG: hypothetical protein ACXW5U_25510 [Thermoanaerobaculia bacterium]
MTDVRRPAIASPGKRTSTFLRRILGFGVWFVIGMAPFLGAYDVPGFIAVIAMYPVDLREWLIPLSGLMMGMLAVIVDYASDRPRISDAKLHRWFLRTVFMFLAAFIALIAVYLFVVVRVAKTLPGNDRVTLAVITGTLEVPPQPPGSDCGCRAAQPADQCIADISLDPANVRACFGSNRVALATLVLALLYLTVTGAFVAAVGIQLVAQRKRRAE